MSEQELFAIEMALVPAPPNEVAAGLIAQQQFLLRQRPSR
jgi:hypothetical protein